MVRLERQGLLVHSRTGTPRRKYYADAHKGTPVQDVWTDINRLDSHSAERIGFDTQKPISLLRRILAASAPTNGELVLDVLALGFRADRVRLRVSAPGAELDTVFDASRPHSVRGLPLGDVRFSIGEAAGPRAECVATINAEPPERSR